MNHNRNVCLTLLVALVFSGIGPLTSKAQYVRVNIDRKTVQAMTAAFAMGALVEDMYQSQNSTILDNYTQAEVAAAVIFASKMLDRKAMTTLGVWTDPTENYYYRRIYNLVGSKLMPKIWTVSGLMLRRPYPAVYWGSYLCKICAEIQSLCYQFESVVTNSVLSFSDIAFLSINPELQRLFDPRQLGGIDWAEAIDRLFEFVGEYSKDKLLGDIEALYQKASAISSLSIETLKDELLSASSFKEYASQGLFELIEVIDHYFQVYESLEQEISAILSSKIGSSKDPSALFSLARYNLKEWLSDYLAASETTRYTQRWYILRSGQTEDEIYAQYFPPLDQASISSSAQWYRLQTTNPSYQPSESELDRIRDNSERYSGYNRDKILQMNRQQEQSTEPSRYFYSINYQLYSYSIYDQGNHRAKSYAYAITVKRRTGTDEIMYSAFYDSSKEELETFKSNLLKQMKVLQERYPNDKFTLSCDDPNYYTPTDEAKMRGVETVVISAACSDHVELASGVIEYKCKVCGSRVDAHTKECAMSTSLPASTDTDHSELQRIIDDYQSKLQQAEQELIQIQANGKEIQQQISETDPYDSETLQGLRDQYDENFLAEQQKKKEIQELKQNLQQANEAMGQMDEDATQSDEDEYNRIPSIMEHLRSSFSIQWNQNGHWSGNTYIVTGKCGSTTKDVTLKVDVSIVRGPKYFLGVKIHRAIIKLDWKLTADYSDSQIVDIVELNSSMSDSDKARLVNQHIAQASEDFPRCQIVTEYVQSDPVDTGSTDDRYHLLWASDRLDIARMVETRLTNIYANLVSMEKFMNYNLTIVDVIRAIAPTSYDAYQRSERTHTICTESLERWRDAALGQSRNGGNNAQ